MQETLDNYISGTNEPSKLIENYRSTTEIPVLVYSHKPWHTKNAHSSLAAKLGVADVPQAQAKFEHCTSGKCKWSDTLSQYTVYSYKLKVYSYCMFCGDEHGNMCYYSPMTRMLQHRLAQVFSKCAASLKFQEAVEEDAIEHWKQFHTGRASLYLKVEDYWKCRYF